MGKAISSGEIKQNMSFDELEGYMNLDQSSASQLIDALKEDGRFIFYETLAGKALIAEYARTEKGYYFIVSTKVSGNSGFLPEDHLAEFHRVFYRGQKDAAIDQLVENLA